MVDLNGMEFVYDETLQLDSEEIPSNIINQTPVETLVFNNPEYIECIEVIDGGRKLKKINKRNEAKTKKIKSQPMLLLSVVTKMLKNHSVGFLKLIVNDCIQNFKNNLSILESKVD